MKVFRQIVIQWQPGQFFRTMHMKVRFEVFRVFQRCCIHMYFARIVFSLKSHGGTTSTAEKSINPRWRVVSTGCIAVPLKIFESYTYERDNGCCTITPTVITMAVTGPCTLATIRPIHLSTQAMTFLHFRSWFCCFLRSSEYSWLHIYTGAGDICPGTCRACIKMLVFSIACLFERALQSDRSQALVAK